MSVYTCRETTDPLSLFDAPTQKSESNPKARGGGKEEGL